MWDRESTEASRGLEREVGLSLPGILLYDIWYPNTAYIVILSVPIPLRLGARGARRLATVYSADTRRLHSAEVRCGMYWEGGAGGTRPSSNQIGIDASVGGGFLIFVRKMAGWADRGLDRARGLLLLFAAVYLAYLPAGTVAEVTPVNYRVTGGQPCLRPSGTHRERARVLSGDGTSRRGGQGQPGTR